MGEGGKEILVDRVVLPVDTLLLVHLCSKPPALLVWVGELAEGVRKLDAADIQLEALGDTRVTSRRPPERRLRRASQGRARRRRRACREGRCRRGARTPPQRSPAPARRRGPPRGRGSASPARRRS